jgi:hypothetical protein
LPVLKEENVSLLLEVGFFKEFYLSILAMNKSTAVQYLNNKYFQYFSEQRIQWLYNIFIENVFH